MYLAYHVTLYPTSWRNCDEKAAAGSGCGFTAFMDGLDHPGLRSLVRYGDSVARGSRLEKAAVDQGTEVGMYQGRDSCPIHPTLQPACRYAAQFNQDLYSPLNTPPC